MSTGNFSRWWFISRTSRFVDIPRLNLRRKRRKKFPRCCLQEEMFYIYHFSVRRAVWGETVSDGRTFGCFIYGMSIQKICFASLGTLVIFRDGYLHFISSGNSGSFLCSTDHSFCGKTRKENYMYVLKWPTYPWNFTYLNFCAVFIIAGHAARLA